MVASHSSSLPRPIIKSASKRNQDLTPQLAIIIVHYHAGGMLAQAVERIMEDTTNSGLSVEVVVVDNGSDEADRRIIGQLPVRVVAPEGNLGYAAALNLGARATSADRILLMNPDVLVLPGCILHLVTALQRAEAAGPRFYWDAEKRFLLPPTEQRSRWAEVTRRAATLGKFPAWSARRNWRNHARLQWLADRPFRSFDLSGALLAIRRDALAKAGWFDEGFRLYFEENDWLLRLKARGLLAVHVPQAEAVHLYNQSAATEPATRAWFEQSKNRFENRHYGVSFARLLALLPERPAPVDSGAESLDQPSLTLPGLRSEPTWLEISATPLGFPAAAEALGPTTTGSWNLPEQIWDHLAPGTYFIRLLSRRGRELGLYSFVRPSNHESKPHEATRTSHQ